MKLLFDIETDSVEMSVVSKVHSIVIQNCDTGKVSSYHDHGSTDGSILAALDHLNQADVLIGHNILCYDLPVLHKLYPTFSPSGLVRDTLVICRLIWADIDATDFEMMKMNRQFPGRLKGSHSLEAWGFRLGLYKGDFCKSTDWQSWSPEMQAYCEQDVRVNVKLWKLVESKDPAEEAVQLEHDFRSVIHLQEQHGFRFDKAKCLNLYSELGRRKQELIDELQKSFPPVVEVMKTPAYWTGTLPSSPFDVGQFPTKGAAKKAKATNIKPGPFKTKSHPFNPASRDQIAERLMEKGWKPTKQTPGGKPQVDESVLEKLPYPEARLLNKYLLVQKRLGQVGDGDNAWLRLEKNGRMHGKVITNGAVTGRCAHFGPNMAQVPSVRMDKETKKPALGELGGWGYESRSCFTADAGQSLVGVDASGLELRCLGHYMAAYDDGAYAREVVHGDVHSLNAAALGLPRSEAKTWVYAYLYGAGDEKLGENAGGAFPDEIAEYKTSRKKAWSAAVARQVKWGALTDDKTIGNILKGGVLRKRFEEKTPALAALKAAIEKIVSSRSDMSNKNGWLWGLDGRKLSVRHKHAALNTLLQSAGSIIVKKATVLFYRRMAERGYVFGKDYAIVVHVHDEWQTTCHNTQEVGQLGVDCIGEAGRHFKFRCELNGEFRVGQNWAETH